MTYCWDMQPRVESNKDNTLRQEELSNADQRLFVERNDNSSRRVPKINDGMIPSQSFVRNVDDSPTHLAERSCQAIPTAP